MTVQVRIIIRAKSQQQLREIVQQEDLDLNCGGAHQKNSGEWEVEAYTSAEIAERLHQSGYQIQIDEQFGARAAARRSDVGTSDRFQGGRVLPHGLGKKE